MSRIEPMTVPLREARERLEELLKAAESGEEVVITLDEGRALKITATVQPPSRGRGLVGSGKGWFVMSDDFDEPLEDFREYME